MKKVCVLFVSVVMITTMEAKSKKDPILMTVAGKQIPVSEFIYMAKRDNNVDFKDKKALAEYLELFKNLKLKVADAEALTVHLAPKFETEMAKYASQLQADYLIDKSGEDSAIYNIYERTRFIPGYKMIYFRFPGGSPDGKRPDLLSKDTVDLYAQAADAYRRIRSGESFDAVAESIAKENEIISMFIDYTYPFQTLKVLEDRLYAMSPGDVSEPIRSNAGYHLIQLEYKIPNPGKVRVAQVYSAYTLSAAPPTEEQMEDARRRSHEVYQKAIAGEDFAELAAKFSDDTIVGRRGGLYPFWGLGENIEQLVDAAFALKEIGDISEPVQTPYGFHVLKLADRKPEITFEEMASNIYEFMRSSIDRSGDLSRSFDEKMKVRHKYVLYTDAYEELKRLADEYLPKDTTFYNLAMSMEKTLFCLDTLHVPQNLFVHFMTLNPVSEKRYAIDFMDEILEHCVRGIVAELEKETLERDYPEYNLMMKAFYDGTLMFEVSDKRVWSRPPAEQVRLEAEWVKELNEKYPVTINKKVVKNIKKYMN